MKNWKDKLYDNIIQYLYLWVSGDDHRFCFEKCMNPFCITDLQPHHWLQDLRRFFLVAMEPFRRKGALRNPIPQVVAPPVKVQGNISGSLQAYLVQNILGQYVFLIGMSVMFGLQNFDLVGLTVKFVGQLLFALLFIQCSTKRSSAWSWRRTIGCCHRATYEEADSPGDDTYLQLCIKMHFFFFWCLWPKNDFAQISSWKNCEIKWTGLSHMTQEEDVPMMILKPMSPTSWRSSKMCHATSTHIESWLIAGFGS